MVNFFDRCFASTVNKNKFLERIRYYSALRFVIKWCANFMIPIYYLLTWRNKRHSLGTSSGGKEQIIVSLTSFPSRINRIWLVIESIMRQSEKPHKIILWLSRDQFPSLDLLPKILLKQRKRGLEIELRDDDLRSHKKYYYALQEFPNDIIITFDDDIFYPTDTIESLLKWHKIFPESIIARYGAKINIVDHAIAPYMSWDPFYQQESPDFRSFFGSGGGTLFPSHSLSPETLNKDIFMDICLNADDIWLNTMCRINNVKIFKIKPCVYSLLPVISKKNISLHSKNIDENLNDKQLRNVRDHFISNRGIDPYSEILH